MLKNLPPIKETHGLEAPPPPNVVEVKSLMKFNDSDDPRNKHRSQCLLSLIITLESEITSMQML